MNEKGGISFVNLLGIVFLVLKLVGVISWNWVWVLAPFWVPIAVIIVLSIILFVLRVVSDEWD
jgi:hypothetical protein